MRRAWCVLLLAFGASLPIAGSLSANTALEVDERATLLNFDDNKATVSLAVNNAGAGGLSAQVTAYALRFLNDAREFVAVDDEIITGRARLDRQASATGW